MLRAVLVVGVLFSGYTYLKNNPTSLDDLVRKLPSVEAVIPAPSPPLPPSPATKPFSQSKRDAMEVYADRRETFYCGCGFTETGLIKTGGCGYLPRKNAARGKRIEWEHVMPAYRFGHERPCWRQGGRDNCRRADVEFRAMEGDLHNLVPAIGELNGDRSHFDFSELDGEPREYGRCDFEVDTGRKLIEPRPEVRGDIARIYFYMAHTYGLTFTRGELDLFARWADEDPVDDWERERNRRIQQIQGNRNPYIVDID